MSPSLCEKGAQYVRSHMPMVGLGTYKVPEVYEVLDAALEAGYRLYDTAQAYYLFHPHIFASSIFCSFIEMKTKLVRLLRLCFQNTD
jgi:hypothetical protein